MEKNNFKVGDRVRVKKDLKEREILEQYLACDPMDEEEKKYVLDFYRDTETVHILEDACDGNFSTKGFDYVLIDYLLELIEEE